MRFSKLILIGVFAIMLGACAPHYGTAPLSLTPQYNFTDYGAASRDASPLWTVIEALLATPDAVY